MPDDSQPTARERHRLLIEQVRAEVTASWRDPFEPSMWLRLMAQSAAARLAAENGPYPPGSAAIISLVPTPLYAERPAHWCTRCGAHTDDPERGAGWRSCGFEATSDLHPGAVLRFAFELCRTCAEKEYP